MEASDGMCAPKELCAATWCSCLELSGWLWTFVGLCAGLFFGINAVWGRMLFCGLLIVMGVINLSRGFRVGKQVSDHADEELNEKQKAAENAEFARGVRLRIFGMVVINLAVWFAVGGVETAIARALLACLGSLVAIASGCFYLVWQKQIRARAPPPPPPPVPEPVAQPVSTCVEIKFRAPHAIDAMLSHWLISTKVAQPQEATPAPPAQPPAPPAEPVQPPAPAPAPAPAPRSPAEGDAPRRRRRDGRGRDVAQGRARDEGRRPPARAPAHGRLRQRRRADGRAQEADRSSSSRPRRRRSPRRRRRRQQRRPGRSSASRCPTAAAPARRSTCRPPTGASSRSCCRRARPGMRLAIKLGDVRRSASENPSPFRAPFPRSFPSALGSKSAISHGRVKRIHRRRARAAAS